MYDPRYQQYPYNHTNSSNWSAQTYHLNHTYLAYQQTGEPHYSDHCIYSEPEFAYSGYDTELRYMSPSEAYSSPYTEASTPIDSSSATSVTYHTLANSPCSFDIVDPLPDHPVRQSVL